MDGSSSKPLESKNPLMIPVRCDCGRSLRAKPEQIGTEIRCWDCRRMVTVSVPRDRQHLGLGLASGLREVFQGRGLLYVLVADLAVTAAFCIPRAGLLVVGLLLMLAAAFYGEAIRQITSGERPSLRSSWRSIRATRSVAKPVACLLMAAGVILPLWVFHAGLHRSPHWSILSIPITGLIWFVLPVLMLAAYGTYKDERLGFRPSLGRLARHPFATILSVTVVPAMLVVSEVVIALTLDGMDYLVFASLDLMPPPANSEVRQGFLYINAIDYRGYEPSALVGQYFRGLRQGYTLTSAIPPSLSLPTEVGLNPEGRYSMPILYGLVRASMTFVVVAGLIIAFAVQAMWIGAIAAVGRVTPMGTVRNPAS